MTLIFMMNDNADSDLALIGEASGGRAPPCGWRMVFRCEFLRVVATLLLVTATLLAMPAASAQAQIFDADADYRVAAGYGSTTTVTLADYLASGVTGVTFTLSCDAMRADYYSSVAVNAGVVTLVPNTLGHVHGTSANTQTETVCTVTATKTSDSMTQDQEFQFYTTAYRTPFALASNAVVLDEARTNEVDIHINGSLGTGQVRVQWRKSGGSISTRIAQGVSNSTVLTIPGLEANTAYEIRVALINGMSFDLYRGGQMATAGTLISPISPATKWVQNLGSSGFGKSATLDVTRADVPTLSINDVTVTEAVGGVDAVFTVTLSNPASTAVTVSYATSNGSGTGAATAGSDYTAISATTLTIGANTLTGTITVRVLDDLVDEPSETFTVTLSSPSGATVADAEGIGTITDNDGVPTLSINDVTVTEAVGGVDAVFTVTLSNPASTAVTVSYATSNGSGTGAATAGSDYTAISATTLTIGANTLTGRITVRVLDDLVDEPSETFTVTLSSPSGATVADAEGIGTITDNDGVPTLSINDVTVTEAVGGVDAVFTVTLSNPASTAVTVSYATSNGSGTGAATAGSDYTAISATTLTIGANTLTGRITVRVLVHDLVDEPSETFTVTLSSPSGATVADAEGIGTITDNDGTPSLSIDDVTVTEAVGGVDAVFTVTLIAVSGRAVTVDYETSNGTATEELDYETRRGTLTIPAGKMEGTIPIPVLDDALDEPSETFTVTLSGPTSATVQDGVGMGTIQDNDAPPSLRIEDVTVVEGTTAEFAVRLSAASAQEVTVAYATSDGTAEEPSDYTETSSTLTFTPGEMEKRIRVPVLDDTVNESDETFTVTLSAPRNATVERPVATGTITDDSGVPSLSINDVTVTEVVGGVDAVFTVTLSNPASTVVTVSYVTSNGSGTGDATAGSDYTAVSATTLTIGANTLTGTITVRVLDDLVDEPSETFTVTLSSPSGATVADDEGIGTITDNDGSPSLSIGDVTVGEGAEAEFTVRLSAVSGLAVMVDFTTSDVSALAELDYETRSGTLTIPAGSTTGKIPVPVLDDVLDEPDETFTVTLSNPTNATVGDGTGTGTIEDGDDSPSLSVGDAFVAESAGAVAEFTVTLSAVSALPVMVGYATEDGTAMADSDYTPIVGRTLTIPAGDMTGTIPVSVLDDALDEPTETFTVRLGAPTNATVADGEGTGTITDDDSPPTLSIGDVTVTEDSGTATFTVRLSVPIDRPVTVDFTTVDGSAVADSDYTATEGMLTFAPGETEKTITVPVIADDVDEPDETFTVTLSNPDNAVFADSEATGTITEGPVEDPTISIEDVTVSETGGTALFTVSLSGPSPRVVTVDFRTMDGTAEAVLDYTATDGTVRFEAGETEQTIMVSVLDDTLDEPDETFTVTLSNPTNATVGDGTGTGTITDDDYPAVAVSYGAVSYTVTEGGSVEVTVVLSAPPGRRVVILLTHMPGGGALESDYSGVPVNVAFDPGETRQTFTVTAVEDAEYDDGESVALGFGALPQGVTAADPEIATVTIDDNNHVPSAVPREWLGRFGRTAATHVVDALDERMRWLAEPPRCAPDRRPEDTVTGTGTIIDDEGSPTLSIDDATVVEASGAVAEFTVTLSAVSAQAVAVDYTTGDGTAVAGSDYTTTGDTLTFAPGETSKTVMVPVTADDVDEPDEIFTVTLSAPTHATVVDGEGTGTITDDEGAPTLSIDDATVIEASGAVAEFTVTLSAVSAQAVTVAYATSDGTAVTGSDYTTTGGTLTFTPGETSKTVMVPVTADDVDEPDETFTVTLSNPTHATLADATSPDRAPRWRCRPPYREPASVVIGGHRLDSGAEPEEALGRNRADRSGDELTRDDGTHGDRGPDTSRSLTARELLAGSSFHIPLAAAEDGRRLSLWGRGTLSRFDGRDGEFTLGGDVMTATLGVDYAGDRLLAGIALSHSQGEGTLSLDGFEGEAESSLTGLYPYLRYGVSERLSVWGMAGYGAGTLTLKEDSTEPIKAGIGMMMGAAGARGRLLSPADVENFALTLKADALFLRTNSDGVSGLRAAADVTRLRLGLEGSYELVSDDGEWLSPFIETGLRHDGGDAETGFGVEIGGGLRYAHPELDLTAELNARGLLAHEDDGFRSWGVSGSLRYDPYPSSELGPSFTLSPSLGSASSGGADALWESGSMADLAASDDRAPGGRLDAELGYGFAVSGVGGVGTPYTGVSLSESGRDFRLGYHLGFDPSLDLGIEGTRRERANGNEALEYVVMLRASMRW